MTLRDDIEALEQDAACTATQAGVSSGLLWHEHVLQRAAALRAHSMPPSQSARIGEAVDRSRSGFLKLVATEGEKLRAAQAGALAEAQQLAADRSRSLDEITGQLRDARLDLEAARRQLAALAEEEQRRAMSRRITDP